MGAFDDPEPGHAQHSHSHSSRNMLSRDPRRRLTLLILLGLFLLISLVAFRRQDQIGDMIETQSHAWSDMRKPPVAAAAGVKEEEEEKKKEKKKEGGKKEEGGTGEMSKEMEEVKVLTEKMEKDTKEKKEKEKEKEKGSGGKEKEKERLKTEERQKPGPSLGDRRLSDGSLVALRNQSLGFAQIYVLNMAGRTDKLDAMRLTASLTGFNFEINEGVSGKDVPDKALSGVFDEGNGKHGVIGCWRGHMNFAHKILENRHASALIMEDDADWDVDFRTQLEAFALGAQTLLDTPKNSDPASPYGDGWDLLWLGHCASEPSDGDNRRVLMKNDQSVTPVSHRVNFGGVPDMTPYDANTRIMYFSKGSTCTYAYALSYHGAQKVLNWLSMEVYNKPVDFGLHDMCADQARGFKCIGVFPQIIADHKPAGGAIKDSDIGFSDLKGAEGVRNKGFSYNIVRSTRLNVDVLIDGKREKAESQWPEDWKKLEGGIQMEFTNKDPKADGQQ